MLFAVGVDYVVAYGSGVVTVVGDCDGDFRAVDAGHEGIPVPVALCGCDSVIACPPAPVIGTENCILCIALCVCCCMTGRCVLKNYKEVIPVVCSVSIVIKEDCLSFSIYNNIFSII